MNPLSYVGIPYKVNGRDRNGLDCFGLDKLLYAEDGILLPDLFAETETEKEKLRNELFKKVKYTKIDKPVKPCIIEIEFRGAPLHSGVYIGNGFFIHATEGRGVIIEPLRRYEKRIRGFYKVENNSI